MKLSTTQLNIVRKLEAINKKYLIALILSLELLIFWGDYVTGPLAPFTFLYLVPIILAAFCLNLQWACFFSLMAAIGGIPVFYQLLDMFEPATVSFNFFSEATIFFTVTFLSTQLKKLLDDFQLHASEDSLTKAHSRWYFYEMCNLELARSYRYKHPMTIAFIDLDNFKDVNDIQGHEKGDRLLFSIAATIKADLREGDFLGRLGGDEFVVLLVEADQEEGEITISRIRDNLLEAMAKSYQKVTFSIGVVTYLADKPSSVDQLLALADRSMYKIKNTTKNAVEYSVA